MLPEMKGLADEAGVRTRSFTIVTDSGDELTKGTVATKITSREGDNINFDVAYSLMSPSDLEYDADGEIVFDKFFKSVGQQIAVGRHFLTGARRDKRVFPVEVKKGEISAFRQICEYIAIDLTNKKGDDVVNRTLDRLGLMTIKAENIV